MKFLLIAPRFHTNLYYRVIALQNAGHQVKILVLYKGQSEYYENIDIEQIGFSLLPNHDKVSAFVSMETTLELWSRKQVKAKWPRLCGNIMNNYSNYNLPILMFANAGEETPLSFDFFQPIQSPQLIFASCKKEFVHESYASYYSSRLIYRQQFTQADALEFKSQVEYYGQHLKLIRTFMDQNLKGYGPTYSNFEDLFYLKIKNKDSFTKDQKPAVVNSPN